MRLPRPPQGDFNDWGNRLNAEIERNDARVLKSGQDVRLVNGERLFETFAHGITAHAGGGQASATALTARINHIGTVASAADSLLLMPAEAGLKQTVINKGANAAQVFGTSPDTINGVATGTGVSQPAGTTTTYYCTQDGAWFS